MWTFKLSCLRHSYDAWVLHDLTAKHLMDRAGYMIRLIERKRNFETHNYKHNEKYFFVFFCQKAERSIAIQFEIRITSNGSLCILCDWKGIIRYEQSTK